MRKERSKKRMKNKIKERRKSKTEDRDGRNGRKEEDER